jgi:hypothetical protein
VETLDNIDRVPAPITREQVELYVAMGRPFICTGMFLDAIPEQGDRDGLIARLGNATLADPAHKHRGTVADYFPLAEVNRGSVMAMPAPDVVASLIAAAQRSPIGREVMELVMWLGRTGCVQRFHCDMDGRDNFLFQAFGTKRVCLVSPAHTQTMQPSLDRKLLLSELSFQFSSVDDKLRLLRYVEGYDCILGSGDMLYIPPLWWHFVEYASDGFAISWRGARTQLLEDLQRRWSSLWPSEWPLWQGIVSRLASAPGAAESHGARARALSLGFDTPGIARDLRELHDELCPGRYAYPDGATDLSCFVVRDLRPLPRKTSPWKADDVPAIQHYIRFAPVIGTHVVLVLDGARIAAEFELDEQEHAATLAMLARIDGRATIAELVASSRWDLDEVCGLLEELAAEGWVVSQTG